MNIVLRWTSNKVIFIAGIMWLVLTLLTVGAFYSGKYVEEKIVSIQLATFSGSIAVHGMRDALSDEGRYLVRAITATEDSNRKASLEASDVPYERLLSLLREYQQVPDVDIHRQRTLVDTLKARIERFGQNRAKMRDAILTGDRMATMFSLEKIVLPSYEELNAIFDQIEEHNEVISAILVSGIQSKIKVLQRSVIVVLLLALFCGVILVTNLSIRKRALHAINQNEGRLRTILDGLPVYVGVLDLKGIVIEINQTALKMAGISREDVIGKPFQQSFWWSHSAESNARMVRTMSEVINGSTVRYDAENKDSHGNQVFLDFFCSPLRDETGDVTHILVSAVNITYRRNLEKTVVHMQRLEAVGALASGLAHDLNNILGPILMAAGLLKTKSLQKGDVRRLQMIEDGVKRGSTIIRQLLKLGRSIANDKEPVQLQKIIKEVCNIIQETFPKVVSLVLNVPEDVRPINANASQILQVLLNLCVNARDAMPNGGTLTISIAEVDLTESSEKSLMIVPGPYVCLTVNDTGTGIPKKIIDNVFSSFFTTKAEGKGSGLGLASVRTIVDSHGGFVEVDSEENIGTTFSVFLPASINTETASNVSSEPLYIGNNELILLVDDEAAMLEITRSTLQAYGYRVVTASNGVEALTIYDQNKEDIALVISDVDMPLMSGPELIRNLQKVHPDLLYIFMTGSGHKALFGEFNPTKILSKPFGTKELLTEINSYLNLRRPVHLN